MAEVVIARWGIEPLHRARRGFDERFLLAMPWLARVILARAARARRGSPLRRVVIGSALRVGLAQVERRDYEALFPFLSPEVEVHMYPDSPGERPIDTKPIYHGRDGYAEISAFFQADFEDFRFELRELLDPGGDRVGGPLARSGRGAHSGVMVRDTDFCVWQLERGLLRRQWVFRSESACSRCSKRLRLRGAKESQRSHPAVQLTRVSPMVARPAVTDGRPPKPVLRVINPVCGRCSARRWAAR